MLVLSNHFDDVGVYRLQILHLDFTTCMNYRIVWSATSSTKYRERKRSSYSQVPWERGESNCSSFDFPVRCECIGSIVPVLVT